MPTIIKDLGYFAAAHNLPSHEGGCWNLHGHNYRVVVSVSGPLQTGGPSSGMVIDFSLLKNIYKEHIHQKLDHAYILANGHHPEWYSVLAGAVGTQKAHALLGKVADLPIAETTAECMSEWIANEIQRHLPMDVLVVWLKLYETETSYAQWWVR